MPRRPPLAAALLLGCLAACGGPGAVHVTTPPGDPRCPAFMASLPRALGRLTERAVSPVSDAVRAWGDPAVVVSCGGSRPAGLLDTDALGISATDGTATYDWTSPEEGADPTVYRIKDPAAPYLVVRLPRSVVPVTALGPLVDALTAARYPTG